ncbi:ubiquitin-conjugating enzyme E2M (UBC12 homolog, yeast) (predicted), isoform CRA_b [Rattus norvegicus]|uniref:Ubiquitin-conjugating enzyme E2M (UBC12 homolog, yeast) (Predicted), isoform CRA_b n=1 Tax=Rattus norvegicus TaxID=10116 RepID=A6KQK8_RAT|nr:ubiquitin-conjugating enzyme E2M (UBC12 homolog, yeast) (predicted), isoform CRA_b [Rattus norvegicus]EDL75757.1 ubiquitin-conjugating enzyme E2M (UBC12 homolog, yeast) (predicted), isoform CRA_b [Rattus norvegicus]EDL75758.1 ubiquitin-conjugating enzyme E2M (UBC12 homolog, yeast) (predicted), isoform CRA_b [Rattus norvegicus]EDL75760.1 ubiquitin-conjugating enzyme E2M (UBC12 homolog, yeast) (predicted), isoform CRA_b [Rattus norvegicus]
MGLGHQAQATHPTTTGGPTRLLKGNVTAWPLPLPSVGWEVQVRSTSVYNEDKFVALGWVGPLTGMRRKQWKNQVISAPGPYTNIREPTSHFQSCPFMPCVGPPIWFLPGTC